MVLAIYSSQFQSVLQLPIFAESWFIIITLVILQDFFRRLEQLSGYDVVNLSNIWSLEDVIFVEVRIEYVQLSLPFSILRITLPKGPLA